MRYFFLIVATAVLFVSVTAAQENSNPNKGSCIDRDVPLNQYAFRKMMRNHFRYTILGSDAPVSGFKVETDKPTVTLKGNIFRSKEDDKKEKNNSLLVNLELTGGLSDEIQELFSGNKLNGYFKANLGFNILFNAGNKAKFALDKKNNPYEWNIRRATLCGFNEEVAKALDSSMTLLVLKSVFNRSVSSFETVVDSIARRARQSENTINGYSQPEKSSLWKRPFSNHPDSIKKYYEDFLTEILKKYGADSTLKGDNLLNDFFTKIKKKTTGLEYDDLLTDTKSAEKFNARIHKYNLINQNEIDTYEDVWVRKRITWLNFSLISENSAFTLYNPNSFVLTDSNSFLPAFSATYNYYNKKSKDNRYIYFRAGIRFSRINSLPDLDDFPYNKTTVLNTGSGETLTTATTGNAYKGELKHGFGLEIPFECFWNPWKKQAIPGFYSKLSYKYGSAWINQNKLTPELGMIWNFKNDEEEAKNMLSIIPFISWSNLLKEYKEPEKINVEKVAERFSIGIKLGVPINLGKRVQPGS